MSYLQTIKDLIRGLSDNDIQRMEIDGVTFDDNRKSIIRSADSLDFQAVPGSGKTTLLVSKLLLIAEKWPFSNRGICVLSHTNVAKDEIKKKITQSGMGTNLLRYPHFIGTIQEFVDTYLASPILRYKGYSLHIIDTDTTRKRMDGYINANWHTKNWKTRNPNQANSASNITINEISPTGMTFNMPGNLTDSNSPTYQGFQTAKQNAMNAGYFFYEDMYAFANYTLIIYLKYTNNIRARFPLVFVDEAQDNNRTQDELLEIIFAHESCIYQRFGDQDQAIYGFEGEESSNKFYQLRKSGINITDSKRFPNQHLNIINKFKISTDNILSVSSDCDAKISPKFLYYAEDNKSQVITDFSNLIDEHFERIDAETGESPIIKIIGAVGKEKDGSITSYIGNFVRNRKPDKIDNLIDLFYLIKSKESRDLQQLFWGIIRFIVKNHDITYNDHKLSLRKKSEIRDFLQQNPENLLRVKKGILYLLKNDIFENLWRTFGERLKTLFGLSALSENITFWKTCDSSIQANTSGQRNTNRCDNDNCLYTPLKNIKIQISTIHGVKGETHDATLVLETKNTYEDVSYALKEGQSNQTRTKFKKQLYVAITRAKSLLCIAVEDTPENHAVLD